MKVIISTKKLKLAQIRYFETERNASEIMEDPVYAFLYDIDGTFVNVLDCTREYPVFDKSIYTNYNSLGEAFGNKLVLVNGELKDGLCYIVERKDCSKLFSKDSISIDELLSYVVNSEDFFIDRIPFLEKASGLSKLSVKRKLKEDYQKLDVFYDYLNSKSGAKQYKKTN